MADFIITIAKSKVENFVNIYIDNIKNVTIETALQIKFGTSNVVNIPISIDKPSVLLEIDYTKYHPKTDVLSVTVELKVNGNIFSKYKLIN
jgi:hypothetical protein